MKAEICQLQDTLLRDTEGKRSLLSICIVIPERHGYISVLATILNLRSWEVGC